MKHTKYVVYRKRNGEVEYAISAIDAGITYWTWTTSIWQAAKCSEDVAFNLAKELDAKTALVTISIDATKQATSLT